VEQFTQLHLGGCSPRPGRMSLPRLAKRVQADHQALHHFLANAAWSVEELRARRLALLHQAVGDRPLSVCLDETGDRKQDQKGKKGKKGQTTEYVAHQDIGHVGGLANGVVSVNAYGVLGTTTVPLAFRFFKPRSRLKAGDVSQSTPLLGVELPSGAVPTGLSH